jgi:hypothetical protein
MPGETAITLPSGQANDWSRIIEPPTTRPLRRRVAAILPEGRGSIRRIACSAGTSGWARCPTDAFLRARIQAIVYVKSTPSQPGRRAAFSRIIAERLEIPPEHSAFELDVLPALLPGNAMFRREIVEEVYYLMQRDAPSLARIPLDEAIDYRFVQRLEAEGFILRPWWSALRPAPGAGQLP